MGQKRLHDHEINSFNVDMVRVDRLDDPDDENGNACHEYGLHVRSAAGDESSFDSHELVLKFQHGPVGTVGANGISQEALIAVVLDRLRSFQKSKFSCRENACAITKLEEALMWLHKRTLDRERRGVEGTHNK